MALHLTDKIIPVKKKYAIQVDQGIIAGCAGGLYENLVEASAILHDHSTGNGYFSLNVYPASVPVSMAITKNGVAADLLESGAILKTAFCGPCFGAGDVPANGGFSIRHTTRNFPNREGSKPGQGQLSAVALMDARSIAATAANGGILTSAADIDYTIPNLKYKYDGDIYKKRCYYGFGKPQPEEELRMGPNITDWPKFDPLQKNLLVRLAAVIRDPVTTTDELIPSGETSSYRSNPLKLSEFALSRRGAGICRPLEGGAGGSGRSQDGQTSGRPRPGDGLPRAPGIDPRRVLNRLGYLRLPAGRRLRPGTGRLLPAGAGRRGEHRLQLRHQTLPLQLHQLGHPPLYGRPAGDLPL